MRLTILICTYNRAQLLERVLDSLNRAVRPPDDQVDILVVANACSDGTAALLDCYQQQAAPKNWLPLEWVEEPTPGKSHALNRAIALLKADVVAFVDDDHRVDSAYLTQLCQAARDYPSASFFCGRILPDWDGSEPAWVHDDGPYRIYPLPVPRFDHGPEGMDISNDGPIPGGGNLFLRREVFERVGNFSTRLGPHGHDLGGGEDSDFVMRALAGGEKLRYVPDVVQYHYVDLERFRFRYLLLKSYQRSRSSVRVYSAEDTSVPLYMWRKLATYLFQAIFCLSWAERRFYLVRSAAALGEVRGFMDPAVSTTAIGTPETRAIPATRTSALDGGGAALAAALGLLGFSAVVSARSLDQLSGATTAVLAVAALITLAVLLKSLYDFSRTGPQLQEEIRSHYASYSLLSVLRLGGWSFVLLALMGLSGSVIYGCLSIALATPVQPMGSAIAALVAIAVITGFQFCRHLLLLPGSIAASSHYRLSRLYPLWRQLTPGRLRGLQNTILASAALVILAGCIRLAQEDVWQLFETGLSVGLIAWFLLKRSTDAPKPGATRTRAGESKRPNIVMIGSDTLRADRLGAVGYRRKLTPFIDTLAARGTLFSSCYVPCARTAPSLVSLFTGTWPHTHGIRDNFISDQEAQLQIAALPTILASQGYRTAAVSDWSGGDLGKFPLGFEKLDLPDDQWNIKYLIRQGPKDLRLFLSLFTHSWFGKRFLPELYYLAGVPLTSRVGRDARRLISELASQDAPFLLNAFIATTHPPFGSEHPYYTLYADPDYSGESKFVMARLTDPWEIIRRQGDSKKEFDLDQIIDLYDGCVRNFDDEVQRIVEHVRACGLEDNTIIVIYSDHGMEFFEHETWGQGNSIRGDFSAKVPLIIADPRQNKGALCPHIVRSIDVAPTLLELAGIDSRPQMDGVSLVSYLKGDTEDLGLAAFNETGIWLTDLPGTPSGHLRYPNLLELLEVPDKQTGTLAIKPEYKNKIIEAKDRMMRAGPWKLTYQPTTSGPIYALYDVASDPECRRDISAQHPDVLEKLREGLLDWIRGSSLQHHASSLGSKI